MKVGVLATGDTAVRAAHSLNTMSSVDEVVVIGSATSKSFRVVADADECDLIVGTGPDAPGRATELGRPLVWDGGTAEPGTIRYGASPVGLLLSVAARETDPQLLAVAHPEIPDTNGRTARFPEPVGPIKVEQAMVDGNVIERGRSKNAFASVLVHAADRRLTIVDSGKFMAGVCLAAAVSLSGTGAVWNAALDYLNECSRLGLVMAEDRDT